MRNVTGREKVVTCSEQNRKLLAFYTGVLKFPVSGVLWLVVIKSPCGVHQSIPKVSWITPAAS